MKQLLMLFKLLEQTDLTKRFETLAAEMKKEEFRELQHRVAFSNNHMARLLGISPQHISQMRIGRYTISPLTRIMMRLMGEKDLEQRLWEVKAKAKLLHLTTKEVKG